MERGFEYCSFCSKTHEQVAHLFIADHTEAAICTACVDLVAEALRKVRAGDLEYDSWGPASPDIGDRNG